MLALGAPRPGRARTRSAAAGRGARRDSDRRNAGLCRAALRTASSSAGSASSGPATRRKSKPIDESTLRPPGRGRPSTSGSARPTRRAGARSARCDRHRVAVAPRDTRRLEPVGHELGELGEVRVERRRRRPAWRRRRARDPGRCAAPARAGRRCRARATPTAPAGRRARRSPSWSSRSVIASIDERRSRGRRRPGRRCASTSATTTCGELAPGRGHGLGGRRARSIALLSANGVWRPRPIRSVSVTTPTTLPPGSATGKWCMPSANIRSSASPASVSAGERHARGTSRSSSTGASRRSPRGHDARPQVAVGDDAPAVARRDQQGRDALGGHPSRRRRRRWRRARR